GKVQLAFRRPDLLVGDLQHGAEQVLLGAEVVVDQGLVAAGTAGNVIDACPLETLLRKFFFGSLQDACTGSGGVARLAGFFIPRRRLAASPSTRACAPSRCHREPRSGSA